MTPDDMTQDEAKKRLHWWRNAAKVLGGITVRGPSGKETRYVWDHVADDMVEERDASRAAGGKK